MAPAKPGVPQREFERQTGTFMIVYTCQPWYVSTVPNDPGHLRQRIRALRQRLSDDLEAILDERPGMIRGHFGTRARVCGNPGCKCASGSLHESKYLSATVGGKTRQVHVPDGDEVTVASAVERYRHFRKRRTHLGIVDAELLQLVDALCVALLASYPPSDPIPQPAKRGRKRVKRARDG